MDTSEGIFPIDPAAILATLYPALLTVARKELEAKGESPAQAEDIVQTATLRWFELTHAEDRAYVYMRKVIKDRVIDLKRPRRDAMSHSPLSLDAPFVEEA